MLNPNGIDLEHHVQPNQFLKLLEAICAVLQMHDKPQAP